MQKKAVIFDFGGVLIDNPLKGMMAHCAKALGVEKEEFREAHDKFIRRFDRGMISERRFWRRVCSHLGVSPPRQKSLLTQAYRKNYHPKKEMFSLAKRLRRRYKVAVLSNTETPVMRAILPKVRGKFDALVFSCREGASKPGQRIYGIALKRLGVKAKESVFIDDRKENVRAARRLGMDAIVFRSYGQTRDALKRLGSVL